MLNHLIDPDDDPVARHLEKLNDKVTDCCFEYRIQCDKLRNAVLSAFDKATPLYKCNEQETDDALLVFDGLKLLANIIDNESVVIYN